jgi:hypothetical protein
MNISELNFIIASTGPGGSCAIVRNRAHHFRGEKAAQKISWNFAQEGGYGKLALWNKTRWEMRTCGKQSNVEALADFGVRNAD